jgi:TetR/AcrR family transcriptional regulator, transcriptional repressor for nem operon
MSLALSPRERIIQTALALFSTEGFHAVGTNQICAEAGVNKSTLYHLFPSKVDVVLAALEVYASDLTKTFNRIAKSKLPAAQKLAQVFDAPFQASQNFKAQCGNVKGCFVGNMALELSGQEERVRTYLTYVFQNWAEAIVPIVQELATDENVDAVGAARSIIAYLQGAILIAKSSNDPQVIQDFAASAIALVR